jgi:hypothetical protein
MALPIVAMAMPAAATEFDLTGNWLVTLQVARPAGLSGQSACFTLNQTGGVLGWENSGTFSVQGSDVTGNYYVIQSVLTAFTSLGNNSYVIFTGHLYHHSIVNTSFLEVADGTPETGNFTATSGCGG